MECIGELKCSLVSISWTRIGRATKSVECKTQMHMEDLYTNICVVWKINVGYKGIDLHYKQASPARLYIPYMDKHTFLKCSPSTLQTMRIHAKWFETYPKSCTGKKRDLDMIFGHIRQLSRLSEYQIFTEFRLINKIWLNKIESRKFWKINLNETNGFGTWYRTYLHLS